MKILFLQNMDNVVGGIVSVNKTLTQQFCSDGQNVSVLSLRHGGDYPPIKYTNDVTSIVVNDVDIWDCPRYSKAIGALKRGKIVQALKVVSARKKYDKQFKTDLIKCKQIIENMNPDIIINSHYEMLDAIPSAYLKRTINHFHTSFNQVYQIKSYRTFFNKYKDKLGKFVWLSSSSCNQAIEFGLTNSIYIYNPVSFLSTQRSDLKQKNVAFIGRFSEEKRVALVVEMFQSVIDKYKISDWHLNLYGIGTLPNDVQTAINSSPFIHLKGSTDDPKSVLLNSSIFMLASSFEGMAIVVLEANECGVPVIAFDFGETIYEQIIHNETGIIVEQNNCQEYEKQLHSLMLDFDLREKLGVKAKDFIEQFSPNVITQQWYKLFDEIID